MQTQHIPQHCTGENSLELEVMDRKNRLYPVKSRNSKILLAQVNRRQRGMPVIAVDDIGHEVRHMQNALKYCLGKERNALAVVILAVNAVAFEIIFVVDEIIRYAVIFHGQKAAILPPPGELDVKAGDRLHFRAVLFRDNAELWQDDRISNPALAI